MTEPIDVPAASRATLMLSSVLRVWAWIPSGISPVLALRPVWPAVQTRSPMRTAGLRCGAGVRPGTLITCRFIALSPLRDIWAGAHCSSGPGEPILLHGWCHIDFDIGCVIILIRDSEFRFGFFKFAK